MLQVEVSHGAGDGNVPVDVLSGDVFDAVPGRHEPELLDDLAAAVDHQVIVAVFAAALVI